MAVLHLNLLIGKFIKFPIPIVKDVHVIPTLY